MRVLLLDAAPGKLLDHELECLLGHGLAVTLNLRRIADDASARVAWTGRVDFTDFDAFDESALIAETIRGGLGHHAVKSRAGVPLRAAFLAAATDPALANRLRVIGGRGRRPVHRRQKPRGIGMDLFMIPDYALPRMHESALKVLLFHPTLLEQRRATVLRRTTAMRTGLSALLLLGTWATASTLPASASDSPVRSTEAPASAPLLSAMRHDLGLTKSQAEARLAAEKTATTVERKAKHAAGSSYGGSWFDAASGKLTVAVTRDANTEAVRATGATVRLVRHSARQLDAAKKRIDALSAPTGVGSWYVDTKANKVVVNVVTAHRNDNDVQTFLAQARQAGPVTVEQTADAPQTFAAGTVGGDPYYTGNVRCSIGFSVYGGFVTAGHCDQHTGAVYGWDGSYVGNFQGSSFPDNDYAWVNVGSGWWTVPVVLGWGTVSDQLVRGSAEAPVGASICRSGSTSHWHCGTVLAKDETVNYSQGAVHQMTKTSVCAEPGDSGGSFISGDQAQGVTSGGWGNCSSGGETWYQPINEILNRYGLTLHTA